MKPIPLQLTHAGAALSADVEIDGAVVAQKLGLDVGTFRQLMHDRKVSVLCERGVGADDGLIRATFYLDGRRFRAVVDRRGQIVRHEI